MTQAIQDLDFDWNNSQNLGPAFFERMRTIQEATPVFWSGNRNAWLVTRYADVEKMLHDDRLSNEHLQKELFNHLGENLEERYPAYFSSMRRWVFNMDGEPHKLRRGLMHDAFDRKTIDQFSLRVNRIMQEIIDERTTEKEVDFLKDICLEYAIKVLLVICGVDQAVSVEEVLAWGMDMSGPLTNTAPTESMLQQAESATIKMSEMLRREIDSLRSKPAPCFLNTLITARVENSNLDEQDIVAIFQNLLFAGFDTVATSLALSVDAIERHPQQKKYFLANMADTNKLEIMLNELGRYIGIPSCVIRTIKSDLELYGYSLKAGDVVYLMLAVANRDPDFYANGFLLDFERPRMAALTFGPGFHRCLGMFQAKLALRVALPLLYKNFKKIGVETPLEYGHNFIVQSPKRMFVSFLHR